MALSKDLISQFAKLTNQDKKVSTEKTVYGTIVEHNGSKYVKFDGSELLTPISSTTNVDDGERVTVMIKNHSATVTGNISAPSVRTTDLSGLEGKITEFDIAIGNKVDTLELVAVQGQIDNLIAKDVTIEDTLSAQDAIIKNLDTNKLSATEADLKYATIDFSNIGKAAIEQFYATSGVIKDAVFEDGYVTGELVGVTIKGDLIEGGTVIADKLVIKGEDGLYYKLNTDGVTTEAEQTEYNSLDGRIITAKSITATKVNVDDLVAFDATIGGFKITESAIHTILKSSIDSPMQGIYMGKDGQIAIGDATNYFKYCKDINGNFKLELSIVDNLKLGGRNLIRNSKNLIFADYYFASNGSEDPLNVSVVDNVLVVTASDSATSTFTATVVGDKLIVTEEYETEPTVKATVVNGKLSIY